MTDLHTSDARSLASALQGLLEEARKLVSDGAESTLVRKVSGHIGIPMARVPTVTAKFMAWEHVNVHRGIETYVAEHSPGSEWFGIAGKRAFQYLVDMLSGAVHDGSFGLGPVDYATVATGPDTAVEAVQLGLVLSRSPDGDPVVIALQGPGEDCDSQCSLQVLAGSREIATATREAVEGHIARHNLFQGKVMAFGLSEHRRNQLLTFLPRPSLRPEDVVLPEGVLDAIERHVVRTAEQSARLRAHGQHLKRGLLLHGPPGTGKTHTIRYLMGRLESTTVIVLSGIAMFKLLKVATSMARKLAPSVVVVEDVDLIAEDRRHTEFGNPALFELLNEMDGVGSEADVTFVLTTNRVDVMEQALAQRPGRIDLATHVPLPDAEARERLLRLYASRTDLDLPDASAIVAASEGVTASFVKELVRRATLLALDEQPGVERVRLDEPTISAALAEMTDEKQLLTRTILGG
ncbi:AAA family ATPase [Lentzea californiensis]|uniref:AAA family ATPase n=1 Tax=Lentzea californiensis TaxID=438851 RepID=UPI0021653DE8|nr:ATP-binding protein [Lentzea californiensis]MCR3749883.1 ATPase family associated with various cellular activities (AAA) [Lentzea californiensis]